MCHLTTVRQFPEVQPTEVKNKIALKERGLMYNSTIPELSFNLTFNLEKKQNKTKTKQQKQLPTTY